MIFVLQLDIVLFLVRGGALTASANIFCGHEIRTVRLYVNTYVRSTELRIFFHGKNSKMLFDSVSFNDKENQASFDKESQVIHHKNTKNNKKWQCKNTCHFKFM